MTCEQHRDVLIAYARGDLMPLAREHLLAHLSHCAPCRALSDELSAALRVAQSWQPAIEAEHALRLQGRLAPYLESATERASRRPRWSVLALASATAAALTLFGVLSWHAMLRDDSPANGGARANLDGVVSLGDRAPASVGVTPGGPAGAPRLVEASANAAATAGTSMNGAPPSFGAELTPDLLATVQRLTPSPFVRVAASAAWDGAVQVRGRHVGVSMQHGAAAFTFAGGAGRRLAIQTPLGLVRVVGTRFLIEMQQRQQGEQPTMVVKVAQGKVEVMLPSERLLVAAGSSLAICGEDSGGDEARAAPCAAPDAGVRASVSALADALLRDAFLTEPARDEREGRTADAGTAGGMGGGTAGATPAAAGGAAAAAAGDTEAPLTRGGDAEASGDGAAKVADESAVLASLARAESRARAGAHSEALVIYQACVEGRLAGMAQSVAARAAFTDLCRYEMARIWGFSLGQPDRARRVFATLAEDHDGEVANQARLALCELAHREGGSCGGIACLEDILEDARAPSELKLEASRLQERWQASAAASAATACPKR